MGMWGHRDLGPPRGPGSSKGFGGHQGVLGTPRLWSSKGSWVLQGVGGPPRGPGDTMLPTSPPGGLWGPLDPLIPSSPHPFPQHHVTPTRACKDTHRKAHTRARPCTPPRPLRSLTCPRMCPPPLHSRVSPAAPASRHGPAAHAPAHTHTSEHACARRGRAVATGTEPPPRHTRTHARPRA